MSKLQLSSCQTTFLLTRSLHYLQRSLNRQQHNTNFHFFIRGHGFSLFPGKLLGYYLNTSTKIIKTHSAITWGYLVQDLEQFNIILRETSLVFHCNIFKFICIDYFYTSIKTSFKILSNTNANFMWDKKSFDEIQFLY